ncbi:uncharacterized protein LY89DRAFT_686580 [Mollisia scopiformis]|uniref:Uncharacterized protein n=1 Tax=Mollisia scopiformis TaxID=149040 RepID=A0A194X5A9_MOLSC|nr:uncharacterized protein LY89DRAFT_686580 [Mollisia scopiformis]KUJ14997.1 hypothetical protein LY89DRAFT_686580 [Mollisia scopiformis]
MSRPKVCSPGALPPVWSILRLVHIAFGPRCLSSHISRIPRWSTRYRNDEITGPVRANAKGEEGEAFTEAM